MMTADTERPPRPQMGGFVPDEPGCFESSFALAGVGGLRRVSSVVLERTPPLVQWWQDCVINSGADAYLYELLIGGHIPEPNRLSEPAYYEQFLPSRRKLYWDARAIVGDERFDGGTKPSAFVRAVADKGVCAERWCPYTGVPEENPLADNDAAGRMSFDQAGKIEMFTCPTMDAALDALAAGHRILFAGPVQQSMAEMGAGDFYEPRGPVLGNHMWQLVGYEEGGAVIRMKNQWPAWGDDNQEAFARRSVLEGSTMAMLAFARTTQYSEAVK